MHQEFWNFDRTRIDLDDLDVTVEFVHSRSLATVTARFRVDPSALSGSVSELKGRIEQITGDILRSLAVSLEPSAKVTL